MNLFSNPKTSSKIYTNILLIFLAIIVIWGGIIDFNNTLKYSAIDLRNRVVGTRVLVEGLDPYFFKWNKGMSDRLLDPQVKPGQLFSRTTVTPATLVLHSPISDLHYSQQKIIWLIVQWSAFWLTVAIFLKQSISSLQKIAILILGGCFFSSFFWRLHAERGQIYILYVFLLAYAFFIAQKPSKYYHTLSGFIVGLTISLRPPAILMLIPFIIYRQWNLLIGSLAGLLSGLLLPLSLTNISIWVNYFLSMIRKTRFTKLSESSLIEQNLDKVNITYPATVEGMTIRQLTHPDLIAGKTSLIDLLNTRFFDNLFEAIDANFNTKSLIVLGLGILTMLGLCGLLYFYSKNSEKSINLVFLSGIILYLLSEFFIPIKRFTYNDVQWLLPLLIIVVTADLQQLLKNQFAFVLLLGILFSMGAWSWINGFLQLSVILITVYVVMTSFMLIKKRAIPKNSTLMD